MCDWSQPWQTGSLHKMRSVEMKLGEMNDVNIFSAKRHMHAALMLGYEHNICPTAVCPCVTYVGEL